MATLSRKSAIHAEIATAFGQVPSWLAAVPESSLDGFWTLFRDFYLAETKIPNKYKELMGIAVSGATRCKYCVLFHTEAARLHGASDEEISEASMMGGVTMLGSTFLNAIAADYDTFAKETREIVAYVKNQAVRKPAARPEPSARA